MRLPIFLTLLLSLTTSTLSFAQAKPGFSATSAAFGKTAEGKQVDLYTLTNSTGMRVQVMNFGATLVTVDVPDKDGQSANVNLRLDTFDDYASGHPLLGSVVGRFANRIDGGKLTIDGETFPLENVGGNGVHIHGGKEGLQNRLWEGHTEVKDDRASVILTHTSPDGHEGYPGTLKITVTYSVLASNTLQLHYHAETDKPTHLNLTNHAYWNLGGAGSGSALDHELTLRCQHYLQADDRKVPTGKYLAVQGTPLDFTKPHAVGERIKAVAGGGYDHCYFFIPPKDGSPGLIAKVRDPDSGRVMEVLTTEPGVQLYAANHLSDKLSWQGKAYGPHHAICLETQHYPDSPNQPQFPSTRLNPGKAYQQTTIFRFSVDG